MPSGSGEYLREHTLRLYATIGRLAWAHGLDETS
jgi:hypothetical protein